jgi:pyridoxamine 5'-phosphate oxidase
VSYDPCSAQPRPDGSSPALPADPIEWFRRWYDDAVVASVPEPSAAVVSTVDANGDPDARMVLVRAVDDDGFVFYTNLDSAKSRQLAARPRGSLVFSWLTLQRAVRVRGAVVPVDDGRADAYFASRPRGSQIAAWASPQSEPIESRAVLEAAWAEHDRRFGDAPVPRPQFWGGWKVVAESIELWHGRPDRLHDRVRYDRDPTAATWRVRRLAP